ncbi:alpha/beta hydrolase [Massilia phyllosphaerae]|uniref:alpha/beta hydrolase n=1 Tax=Massilia phyllosphaerae TaxID=3106034 RepID=UPI002B1CBD25|nr:alpha/beta hydrolase [Massilia sp. SGZ-792]
MRIPLLSSFLILVLLGAAALWVLGSALIKVEPRAVTLDVALGAEPLTLDAGPGRRVAASYIPALGTSKGGILLLHGIHGDRRQMEARAAFLHREGYAVMLIDLPGQGASTAPAVTFGLTEAEGVRAALAELQRRLPGRRIGVIGVSLGAASLVLCRDCPKVDAAVLESMYPSIEEAVEDRLRMRLGALGAPLSRLLLWQLPLRLDIQPAQLRPIARVGSLGMPLLIVAGSADRHTTLAETERLYAAAAAPKSLWVVDGAAHVDLHSYAPAEYERRIGAFLERYVAGH